MLFGNPFELKESELKRALCFAAHDVTADEIFSFIFLHFKFMFLTKFFSYLSYLLTIIFKKTAGKKLKL